MNKSREIRWKIDARYTADTMPLDRLAEYLTHLAAVLGRPHSLHLVKMENASANAVLRVDDQFVEHIRLRGAEIQRGIAPPMAMRSYTRINEMLGEDGGLATLYLGDAEIVPFPGGNSLLDLHQVVVPTVHQQGHLDGVLIKVGGEKDWVPVQLVPVGGIRLSGCKAKKGLAKRLGHHLWEPIRLYGRGSWKRTERGWEIDNFLIDQFEILSGDGLPEVVTALRAVKTDWHDTPVADILSEAND